MALDPPAVEDAEVHDAVVRRLHAARTRCFEGPEGRVEPYVHARDELEAQVHIIARKVGDGDFVLEAVAVSVDALDQFFAGFILGVGFPGIDELNPSFFRDLHEPLHVMEQEIHTLICRGSPGKAEGEHIQIHGDAGRFIYIAKQVLLCLLVGVPELLLRDITAPDKELRFICPPRNIDIEETGYFRTGPGEGVYAVRYGMNGIAGEHVLRHLAVLLCHAIHVLAQVEGQERHIEAILACQVFQHVERDQLSAELPDEIIGEFIMPRFHRRMGGEDAKIPYAGDIPDRPLVPDTLDIALEPEEQLDDEEAGMAFVHVVLLDMKTEGMEHAHAAHAEDKLLLDPVRGVSSVERVGNPPVFRSIVRRVRVQKENGHGPARGAGNRIKPCLYVDSTSLDLHLDLLRQKLHIVRGIPDRRLFRLPALSVDLLGKVAFAADERHCHEGQLEISR